MIDNFLSDRQQEDKYFIYMEYQGAFIQLLTTVELYDDITNRCSDDILFKFKGICITNEFAKQLVPVFNHGLKFTHHNKIQYMLPSNPASIIREIFGIK